MCHRLVLGEMHQYSDLHSGRCDTAKFASSSELSSKKLEN